VPSAVAPVQSRGEQVAIFRWTRHLTVCALPCRPLLTEIALHEYHDVEAAARRVDMEG